MGALLATIIALAKALTAYLELKSKSFHYDIITRSQVKQTDIINEIEKLRTVNTTASADRADFLRKQLIAEKQFIEHISAECANTAAGTNSPDKRG
jgi:hypothetical protein